MSFRYILVVVVLLALICGIETSSGGWKKLIQIPVGEVHCGFFFDEQTGFTGSGSWNVGIPALIRRTNDGGKTWTLCTTPKEKGFVSNIFMKDVLIGYASIMSSDTIPVSSIWKTTDGGITWFDNTHKNNTYSTCVYATNNALIKTQWSNFDPGEFSLDDGLSYSRISGAFIDTVPDFSNGIDFADDKNGVVVEGEGGLGGVLPCWITQDGGMSWYAGDKIPEAFSVYALKGTQTFFALPEDEQFAPGNTVYWSEDGGAHWDKRSINDQALSFTGHITGVGNTMYVQADNISRRGMIRSDDLGLTWKDVGGPSNLRDTRFVVTGCKGQVVYAFDDIGDIWKTTDGGDGSLSVASNGDLFSLPQDSIYMETRYCKSVRSIIHLTNTSCDSLQIDSITFSPDPLHEFSVDTITSNISIQASAYQFGIPIVFHSDSNVIRHVLIHVYAHDGIKSFDSTIVLVAKQSTAPEPYLGVLKKTKVGDTVLVPVYLRATTDSFAFKHCSFHLTYDGDILTPTKTSFETKGTLSALGTVTTGNAEKNGLFCTVDFKNPITQDSNLILPLIYLRMRVTLSRNLSCVVRMDTFFISTTAPLPLCFQPATEFVVNTVCGDSAVSSYMKNGNLLGLVSVHPNPNSGGDVIAEIELAQPAILDAELIDAMGRESMKIVSGKEFQSGKQHFIMNTSSLASGRYLLRIRTSDGEVIQESLVVSR